MYIKQALIIPIKLNNNSLLLRFDIYRYNALMESIAFWNKAEPPRLNEIDPASKTWNTIDAVVDKVDQAGVYTERATQLLGQAKALSGIRKYWKARQWPETMKSVSQARRDLGEHTDMIATELDFAFKEAKDRRFQEQLGAALQQGGITGTPESADCGQLNLTALAGLLKDKPKATSAATLTLVRSAAVIYEVRKRQADGEFRQLLTFLKPWAGMDSTAWDLAHIEASGGAHGFASVKPVAGEAHCRIHDSCIDELELARGNALNHVVNLDLKESLLRTSVSGNPGNLRFNGDTDDLSNKIAIAQELTKADTASYPNVEKVQQTPTCRPACLVRPLTEFP